MNTWKKIQRRHGAEDLSAGLNAQIPELYRQLSEPQKKIMLLSAILTAAANDETAVQA
ncbi:MAG: hypothetical protein K2O18_08185 [Oscillospiraceae bacterium]|nr:hypothetical protein [Oscillospiraceae bacterium]